jgi:uncharacterized protein YjlB
MATGPESVTFADDGRIPNSRLPLLLYKSALPADPAAMERHFAAEGWTNGWRDGIFPYHHFHSIAHEVLGIVSGTALVRFGGEGGTDLPVAAGDVVVIPAGVGHCRREASPDLLVVGAYPGGADWDVCRGEPADHDRVRANIAAVPLPATDPVHGAHGPLCRLWSQG